MQKWKKNILWEIWKACSFRYKTKSLRKDVTHPYAPLKVGKGNWKTMRLRRRANTSSFLLQVDFLLISLPVNVDLNHFFRKKDTEKKNKAELLTG